MLRLIYIFSSLVLKSTPRCKQKAKREGMGALTLDDYFLSAVLALVTIPISVVLQITKITLTPQIPTPIVACLSYFGAVGCIISFLQAGDDIVDDVYIPPETFSARTFSAQPYPRRSFGDANFESRCLRYPVHRCPGAVPHLVPVTRS